MIKKKQGILYKHLKISNMKVKPQSILWMIRGQGNQH